MRKKFINPYIYWVFSRFYLDVLVGEIVEYAQGDKLGKCAFFPLLAARTHPKPIRTIRSKPIHPIKTKNSTILSRLMKIDYERLAQECGTAVPGFRKGDLVKVYTEHYGK